MYVLNTFTLFKKGGALPEEEFIISVFCCVEDLLQMRPELHRQRQRGFAPNLCDSEVITMEIVGEFLAMDSDKAIWSYFCKHRLFLFPKLGSRSAFVRQVANLWHVKQELQALLSQKMGAWSDNIHI